MLGRAGGCSELEDLFLLADDIPTLRRRFPQLQDNDDQVLRLIAENLSMPPRLVGYSSDPAIYSTHVPIRVNYPRVRQGAVLAFSGVLPPGLVLDQGSGIISGTPIMQIEEVAFRITATNPRGESCYDLAITVKDEEPC
jgi:hypothetical protein